MFKNMPQHKDIVPQRVKNAGNQFRVFRHILPLPSRLLLLLKRW